MSKVIDAADALAERERRQQLLRMRAVPLYRDQELLEVRGRSMPWPDRKVDLIRLRQIAHRNHPRGEFCVVAGVDLTGRVELQLRIHPTWAAWMSYMTGKYGEMDGLALATRYSEEMLSAAASN